MPKALWEYYVKVNGRWTKSTEKGYEAHQGAKRAHFTLPKQGERYQVTTSILLRSMKLEKGEIVEILSITPGTVVLKSRSGATIDVESYRIAPPVFKLLEG
jgi:hypothetical protein